MGTAEKPFSMKFHESVLAFKKRPLGERLALLVHTGTITAADREKTLQKIARKKKKNTER